MNRKCILLLITICILFGITLFPTMGKADAAEQTVLATTYPIYQIVRNVTQGRDGVKVDLMLPSQMGCPHDYALTPQDMIRISKQSHPEMMEIFLTMLNSHKIEAA